MKTLTYTAFKFWLNALGLEIIKTRNTSDNEGVRASYLVYCKLTGRDPRRQPEHK